MPRLRPMRALCVNRPGIEDPRRDQFGLTGLHTISVDLNLSAKLVLRSSANLLTGRSRRLGLGRKSPDKSSACIPEGRAGARNNANINDITPITTTTD